MAPVYKAYQPAVDRSVALKVLPGQLQQDPAFAQRFEQEARIIARLEHPHILPVYDYGTDRGTTYIAMRYLAGGTAGLHGFADMTRSLRHHPGERSRDLRTRLISLRQLQ